MSLKPRSIAPASIPIAFAPQGAVLELRTGKATEFTDDGVFIASNTLWPPRTALTLLLAIPGERFPVQFSGVVAWARTQDVSGMFVAFTQPADHPTREKLRAQRPATPAPAAAAALAAKDQEAR